MSTEVASDDNDVWKPLIGLTITEVVNSLFKKDVEEKTFRAMMEQNKYFKLQEERHLIAFIIARWNTVDALSGEVLDSDGRTGDQLRSQSYIDQVSGVPTGVSIWDILAADWLSEAVKPLIKALEDGKVGIVGQREPVLAVDQALEAVPYDALDNRRWRLHREKSRVEVLDTEGEVEAVFRRARLVEVSPATPLIIDNAPVPDSVCSDAHEVDLAEKVRRLLMQEEWDMAKGSQAIADAFRTKHSEIRLTRKRIMEVVDDVRGCKLSRGRPPGSKK